MTCGVVNSRSRGSQHGFGPLGGVNTWCIRNNFVGNNMRRDMKCLYGHEGSQDKSHGNRHLAVLRGDPRHPDGRFSMYSDWSCAVK